MRRAFHLMVVGLVSALLVFCSDVLLYPTKVSARFDPPAIFQQFEHGFMIEINDTVEVYPYNEKDRLGYNRLAYAFPKNNISPLKENAVANLPPERDYKPTGNFGKVWSNSLHIMQKLGWAITPPIQYEADTGAASGYYRSLPMNYSVKTNGASIIGLSDSVDFPLLDGAALHGGQMIWVYVQENEQTHQSCDAQRIQFEAGGYSAMVDGTVSEGCAEGVYLLRAMAQQRMTVFLFYESHPVTGNVVAPDGTNLQMPNNEVLFDGILPANGDYSIRLRQDFSEPEPMFPYKYQSDQYQNGYYTLLVVIR